MGHMKRLCCVCKVHHIRIHHSADNSCEEHDPHCVNAKLDIWIVWVMLCMLMIAQ